MDYDVENPDLRWDTMTAQDVIAMVTTDPNAVLSQSGAPPSLHSQHVGPASAD